MDVIYTYFNFSWAFIGEPSFKPVARLTDEPSEIAPGIVALHAGAFEKDPAAELDLAAFAPESCGVRELARFDRRVLPLSDIVSRSESVVWLVECGESAKQKAGEINPPALRLHWRNWVRIDLT